MSALQDETHPPPEWESYTDIPVGEVLRRARTYYNLSLKDVADALRIRAGQLAAVEEGRTETLPGRVYAIGFVRAYAEYLGLDGNRMVHLFKSQSGGTRVRPELHFPAPASESKVPNFYILGGSFAVLVALLGIVSIWSMGGSNGISGIPSVASITGGGAQATPSEQPPLEDAMAEVLVRVADETRADSAAGAQAVPSGRIVIKVIDSVWVEIRNAQHKPLLSRILKPGDSYIVPDEPGLKMDMGNAGALEFIVDGQPVPKLGAVGDVKRAVPLEADLLKMTASPVAPAAGMPAVQVPAGTR